MFSSRTSTLLRTSLQRLAVQQQSRSLAGVAVKGSSAIVPTSLVRGWYNTFGKSTALYASWLMLLIVVGEYTTGKITDGLWVANNYGKTFGTVDWSKFDEFEDEEEEEEEDEDGDDDDDDE